MLSSMFYIVLQMLAIVVDKLIRLQIINCSTVINWIFSKEMVPDFSRFVRSVVSYQLVKSGADP